MTMLPDRSRGRDGALLFSNTAVCWSLRGRMYGSHSRGIHTQAAQHASTNTFLFEWMATRHQMKGNATWGRRMLCLAGDGYSPPTEHGLSMASFSQLCCDALHALPSSAELMPAVPLEDDDALTTGLLPWRRGQCGTGIARCSALCRPVPMSMIDHLHFVPGACGQVLLATATSGTPSKRVPLNRPLNPEPVAERRPLRRLAPRQLVRQ